ncbi:MAG TPA: response regulator [Bryobacteraceae bacterium]|nr:response regulator [Bryobacteraceae bacterium]
MTNLDDELARDYLTESAEHLSDIESDLLALEKSGAGFDEELLNRVFRSVHSIKGGAGYFDLLKVRGLAHQMEDVLALIRSHKLVPTPERVRILLSATDRMRDLIQNAVTSNQAETADVLAALGGILADPSIPSTKTTSSFDKRREGARIVRVLLVEDDFVSRLMLQTFLSRYGECHIAVNGKEAVEAFQIALEQGQKYDMICMDIMMPEMDGREAVRQIRALEEGHGILSSSGAKIVMTTAVEDIKEVIQCFQQLCDAYLMKPIDLGQLLSLMKCYQLVQ